MELSVKVKRITRQELVDLLSSAVPAISYWGSISYNEASYKAAENFFNTEAGKYFRSFSDETCYEDILAEILMSGDTLQIIDSKDGHIEFLNYSDILDGITNAIRFGIVDADPMEWDGECADAIIQCAAFGCIVYA